MRPRRRRSLDHRYNLEIFLGGSPETARAAYQDASGAMLVTPRAPPTLILHGGLDINVFTEQAEVLDRNLAAAGVPHALVSLPWAGHAFDFVNFNTPGADWKVCDRALLGERYAMIAQPAMNGAAA